MICTNLGCTDPATARVLVGVSYMPKCFTHEREYADRYGSRDIIPLRTESPFAQQLRQRSLRAKAISGDPML